MRGSKRKKKKGQVRSWGGASRSSPRSAADPQGIGRTELSPARLSSYVLPPVEVDGGGGVEASLGAEVMGDEAGEVVVSAVAKRAGAAGDLMVAVAVGGVEGMVGGLVWGGRVGGGGKGWGGEAEVMVEVCLGSEAEGDDEDGAMGVDCRDRGEVKEASTVCGG